MSRRQQATFREARPVPPFWRVKFDLGLPPGPGQFVLADLGGAVREALFPAARDESIFEVVVTPGHPATHLLPGSAVDMLGPFGRGFRLREVGRLLLVAEASLLPPLLPLLGAAATVALIVEAPTRVFLPPPRHLPPAVELHLLTHDGSAGHKGRLETTENGSPLERLLAWADLACFSCHPERYPALARIVKGVRLQPAEDFAQALVQVPMACGVGACEICRIRTRRGERRACNDGPVFDLLTLDV
ncbi:MAG: hypothetical protein ACP5GX_01545 [Anaerolineae bacterium]